MSDTEEHRKRQVASSEDRIAIDGRSKPKIIAAHCLLAAACIASALAISIPVQGQTCPLSYGTTDAAKSNWLFLYFPTSSDSTFPAYGTSVSPLAPFDVSALSAGIGTTTQLINEIGTVVIDDYCEFNVQVHTTTTNPALLASPPARRVTVGIGDDNSGAWGEAQEVDIGDAIDIDFARVWAGTYVTCEGGNGPSGSGCSTTGSLTGSNATLEHWGQAIGGTAAHEAGHTYGLAHSDDDPPVDCDVSGPTPTPGEDPYYQHLMPAGCNLTGPQRADYRRHFSNRTYGLLATNVGLSIQTMHNWNLTNPNAEQGNSLAIDFLSVLPTVSISWSFAGASSPWINPTVSGPSGTAVFKGATYNKYTITWSAPNPAWSDPSPGIVAGGAVFHIGTTFTGVDFNAPDPIIIQDVTLFDASSNPLALHPRLAGYDAGTLDAANGTFSLHFFPVAGAPSLRLQSARIYQLPRVAAIESMVGDGRPLTRDKTPIVPWSVIECPSSNLREGATCSVANIAQPPHIKETYGLGQPGVYDCSQGVPHLPPRKPNQPSTRLQDSPNPLDYEGPICAGTQQDPFPSTTVYVIATFVDPAAKHYDPVSRQYVVGPLVSTAYYQFAGIRQTQSSSSLQYAAKFLCGPMERHDDRDDKEHHAHPAEWGQVARGDYYTAINAHNPTNKSAVIKFKFASTLPDGKSGPVSRFSEIKLGADETISLDCSAVYKLLHAKPGFVDGFAVIESDVEQDVVAVYTAAGEHEKVQTLQTERVPVRKLK